MRIKNTPTTTLKHIPIATKSQSSGIGMKSSRLPSMGKRQSLSCLKKKCWIIFSKYIRMRDCLKTTGCTSFGLCVTCKKRYHLKLLQAGHFIAGRHNANLFSEKGVHAQCYTCNLVLKGNTLEYRRQIIKLYGEGADLELERESRQVRKFAPQELRDLIEYYKTEIASMEGKE